MIIKRNVLFSDKETENKGKDKSIGKHIILDGGIAGTAIGAGIGTYGKTAKKIRNKVSNYNLWDHSVIESDACNLMDDGFSPLKKKMLKEIQVRNNAIRRRSDIANAMINKNILSKSAKGAVIGTGIGAGIYGTSKLVNKKNRQNEDKT